MWEFTDPDLGNTIGQPVVARMADGTWVAVFGNGYNSDNHSAMLFIVRLADGVLLKKIDTGVGSIAASNGLATPSLLADGTRTIRTVYAGDSRGNLWKFDVSDANPANWAIAFTASGAPAPLFKATDSTGAPQPITAPVEIGRHPNGGYMIYFGTGKFFETGDNIVGGNVRRCRASTECGTRLRPSAITYPAADRQAVLTRQTSPYEGQTDRQQLQRRVTTQNAVNYSFSRGWYIDLQSPTLGAQGERVVSLADLAQQPSDFSDADSVARTRASSAAAAGSWSWTPSAACGSSNRRSTSPRTATSTPSDFVTVAIGGTTVTVAPSAIQSREGIIDTPAVVDSGTAKKSRSPAARPATSKCLRERGSGDRRAARGVNCASGATK